MSDPTIVLLSCGHERQMSAIAAQVAVRASADVWCVRCQGPRKPVAPTP